MTRIIFTDGENVQHTIDAAEGLSLMEALRAQDVGIEGECEGSLACATCHVWVDDEWLGLLDQPLDGEADMLDCAFHVRANSRLSCQIVISPAIDGLRARMPRKRQD